MGLTLVIMAAGMGSRFGGIKQIEPVGPNGEMMLDYSIFDARKAGFDKVVFVIKKEFEAQFHEKVIARLQHKMKCACVFQEIVDLPAGLKCPPGRIKPWGTAHAALCAKPAVDGAFAVINADDFYGASAFAALADFLNGLDADSERHYCMAGYALKNTLSEKGAVSRGVCALNGDGKLISVTERTQIEKADDGAIFFTEGSTKTPLSGDAVVSLNCWGFTKDFFGEIERQFPDFFAANASALEKAEFYLPSVVETLLAEKKADVKVLDCQEKWYGFTYQEDKIAVKSAIREMIAEGKYPGDLWG
jgi:NDP-sugar pyrophosphorylase family protein